MSIVLVVEDHPFNRMLLTEVLEQAGHQVLGVGSAEAALDVLGDYRPDVLLTDIQLPGISGIALSLRVKEKFPHTVIIGMTALSQPQQAEAFVTGSFSRLLGKPFPIQSINPIIIDTMAEMTATMPGEPGNARRPA